MSMNMNIGSAGASTPNFDRTNVPSVTPAAKTDTTDSSNKKWTMPDPDASIVTMKEAKIAELRGEHISPGEEQIIKAIEKANKALMGASTSFEFSIHEKTKQIMVKVINKDTGEVIREIPPEKTLDMVAKMWEMAGILVDKKV